MPLIIWTDRAGRFSPLKLAAFLCCIGPMLLLTLMALTGDLGSKPLTYAIHDTGDWAVRFLLISLLVTPLRSLANLPKLIIVRRMLGVTTLAYVLVHLALYVVEQRYDMFKVASEIVLRLYLTIGFVALLGLLALGLTSTDSMIQRLGSVRWNRLHGLVYGLTVLSLLHFFLQSKLDVTQPVLMTGLFLWLMGYRLMRRYGFGTGLIALLLLAIAAGLATALVEAAWYAARSGVMVLRVLAANLDISLSIRPAWWVLVAGLVMVALAFFRGRDRRSGARAEASPAVASGHLAPTAVSK
ncbi:MAG: ferric reductase-like transmembrane domain-containing protein [Hyphomicrobiales bacterium]|nr:ferric reductase-like transmembrane domain-containing protein [Hyphomicrobiales bacterium]